MTEELGNWIVNYLPEEGGRYTGSLSLTAENLGFVSMYESSNKTIVKAIFLDVGSYGAAGGHSVYRYSNDAEAHVELPMNEIVGVRPSKRGILKQVVVTMQGGDEFVFEYGMMSVKKIVGAIESARTS